MTIQINDNRWLHDLQQEFSRTFPFLKIEFLAKTSSEKPAARAYRLVKAGVRKVCDIRKSHEEGELKIMPSMTAEQLENFFVKQFNLFVKVFHKTGQRWLETIHTNKWTLEEQNEHAKKISKAKVEHRVLF